MSESSDPAAAMRGRIEQMVTGYSLSAILFAACDLRLFDHLAGGPARPEALAERMGASRTGVSRLCTALTALGILERSPDGRFAAPAPLVELLGGGGPGSLLPLVLHHQRHLAPLMARLPEAVRSARPQHEAWRFADPDAGQRTCYEELCRHPEEYALFLEGMERTSAGVGDDIGRAHDFSGVRRLIDLGGGGGHVARELLAGVPGLTIEMIDLPVACQMAERRAAEEGLSGRFHATAGDLTRPLPDGVVEPAEAVLLSGVLADFTREDSLAILANASRLLRADGVLLVSETLLDDTRTGPVMPALLSLLMLAATPGDSFTLAELTALLERAGFSSIDHRPPRVPGRRDLVVARR